MKPLNVRGSIAAIAAVWVLGLLLVACAPTAQSGRVGGGQFDAPYDGPIETVALVLDPRSSWLTSETESALYDTALFAFMGHPYAYQRYDLIERSRVDVLTAEFGLARAGLIDTETAANIGRLLGARSIVILSVSGVSASPFSTTIMGIGAGGVDVRASVQMRMVDVETGRIIAAAQRAMQKVVPRGISFRGMGASGSPQDAAILSVVTEGAELAIDDLMRAVAR